MIVEFANYKNQYFSILGDSISTLAGFNPPECAVFYEGENKYLSGVFAPEDTWWGQVLDALGGKLLVNQSWSGSLVCKHPQCEIESYGCSDARTGSLGTAERTPDVVLVFMGFNDFGWAMCPTPAAGEEDLAVFSVAYSQMLEKIKANYPQAEIWCLTLPRSRWSRCPEREVPIIRGGWHQEDYCRAIHSCARKAGCRVVDVFLPNQPYDTMDGYHPTAEGMKTIAESVLRAIQI